MLRLLQEPTVTAYQESNLTSPWMKL